jgi:hypothetical protein
VHTVKKNTNVLVVASKEIGLEPYADKTKYLVMFRVQNAGRSHSIKTDNKSCKGVLQFKYLGTNVTNQNSIQEEIKSRMMSGNACYHSMQNILSSSLLAKSMKIEICRNIILSIVLYGCEIWSLTLRKEGRLRVFENRVLRRIFGHRRDDVKLDGENYRMRSLISFILHPILFG